MTNYYRSIIGTADATSWNFDVTSLYLGETPWDANSLVAPFSAQEAFAAVRSMNANSAPGPNGFGLA